MIGPNFVTRSPPVTRLSHDCHTIIFSISRYGAGMSRRHAIKSRFSLLCARGNSCTTTPVGAYVSLTNKYHVTPCDNVTAMRHKGLDVTLLSHDHGLTFNHVTTGGCL